jgi:hypothetical protein
MATKQTSKKATGPVKAKPAKVTKPAEKPTPKPAPKVQPKEPIKTAAKPVVTAPAKTVAKPVVTAPAKTVAKPVVMAPAKTVAVAAAATVIADPKPAVELRPQALAADPTPGRAAAGGALTLSVQTSQGNAANGNTQPANILVLVSDRGAPVVDLTKDHFTLMEHFEVPGQMAPFSNNISSFRNAGTGAYLLQTKPITGAAWRSGHHLAQLLVSDDEERQGQIAFKLIIR